MVGIGGAGLDGNLYDADVLAGSGPQALDAPVPVPPFRQRDVISGPWLLRDTLELGALPGAVPCARLHARHVLWEWSRTWPALDELGESLELLVSELVTNAVAVSRSPDRILPVRLWLLADRARVLLLVRDTSPRPPIALTPAQDAESGRGMMLVEAMSQRWDWYLTQESGGDGKVVWALAQSLRCRPVIASHTQPSPWSPVRPKNWMASCAQSGKWNPRL